MFSISFIPSLPVLVFITFLVLKLAAVSQVANWSWWWVTSPLWIPCGIFLAIAVVFLIFYVAVSALSAIWK